MYARTSREQLTGWLFVAPITLVILCFVAYPFLRAIFFSLTNKTIGIKELHFIGLQNYITLWGDVIFRKSLQNTIVFTFSAVALKFIFGLLMALYLNQLTRFRNIMTGIVLFPWVVPTAIGTLIWMWMLNDVTGIINYLLIALGLIQAPIAWLGNPVLAMLCVILINAWRGTPFYGITLLAGLRNIPIEYYEAASLDGASTWQTFVHITVPCLKPVMLVVTILTTIWTFSDFQIVYILTKGGPAGATHLFSTLTYEIGFLTGKLGKAIGVSIYLFPLLIGLILILTKYMKMGEEIS